MRAYLLLLACAAVALAGQASIELRAVLSTRALAEQLDRANQHGDNVDREIAELRAALVSNAAENNTLQTLARIEQSSATETSDGARQVKFLCSALSTYGELIQDEPLSGPYLVNWANVRQILSSTECREKLTSGEIAQVVALARKSDPTNVAVAFAAAQLALWEGKRQEALQLFRAALDLGTGASAQMERYIVRALRSPQDLMSVIPPRFPHVLRWSQLVLDGHPERRLEYREVLAKLQQSAVTRALEELRANQVGLEIVQKWLLALFDFAADTPTRQLLDRTLSEDLNDRTSDQRALRDYLRDRAQYASLEVVAGLRLNDSQPQRGVVSSWGRRGLLTLDENYTSAGVFVGDKQSVHFVQLQALKIGTRIDPAELHIRISNDNQNWRDPDVAPILRKISTPSRDLLVYEFQGLETRYLKVTFERALRRAQFGAPLPLLITLYGNSLRGG